MLRKGLCLVLIMVLAICNIQVYAQVERNEDDFEFNNLFIETIAQSSSELYDSIYLYQAALMGWAVDDLYLYSNDAFFLSLYNLIYNEDFEFKTEPLVINGVDNPVDNYGNPLHDMNLEKQIRIQRMVDDGYLLEEEIETYPITKLDLAIILYRIYKDVLPFNGSVAYSDTDSIEVCWAAERCMPFYLNRSGYEVYPNQSLHDSVQYTTCLSYAYLYFPNPITGKYNQLILNSDSTIELEGVNFTSEDISASIESVRAKVMRPRLGYWVRDVLNNESCSRLADEYLSTKSSDALVEIQSIIEEQYNLLPYQHDLGYIGYMCKLFTVIDK